MFHQAKLSLGAGLGEKMSIFHLVLLPDHVHVLLPDHEHVPQCN